MLATSRSRLAAAGGVLLVLAVVLGGFLLSRGGTVSGNAADATLTIFLGTAQVTASGTQNAAPVVSGTHLHSGDMITTGPNSRANIIFGNGSQIRLDANTTLAVKQLSHDAAGFHVDLHQGAGKTWSRVTAPVGRSSFSVRGPNKSTAEVRGAEFSVYIKKDAVGKTTVEVVTWSGSVDVSAANLKVLSVPGGSQVTITEKQTSPLQSTAVSPANKGDQFTIFNNAVTQSQTAGPGPSPGAGGGLITARGPTAVGTGQLAQGSETTVQPGVQVAGAGTTDVVYSLDWPGSTFELAVIDPDGNEYLRQSSVTHPFSVIVPKVRAGQWQYKVHDLESTASETWVVIVSTLSPSTHEATPIFISTGPCEHTVQAGASADAWAVVAHDPSGAPTLAVAGVSSNPAGTTALPSWASFSAATGGFNFTPPIDTPASDLLIAVTAAFSGQSPATINCTEHVVAAPNASTVS